MIENFKTGSIGIDESEKKSWVIIENRVGSAWKSFRLIRQLRNKQLVQQIFVTSFSIISLIYRLISVIRVSFSEIPPSFSLSLYIYFIPRMLRNIHREIPQ